MAETTGKVELFTGVGKPPEERDYPLPQELEPGAVLAKISMATVCGSDMYSWRGRRPFPTPSVLGQVPPYARDSERQGTTGAHHERIHLIGGVLCHWYP